jgi:homoserine dehydrogenase
VREAWKLGYTEPDPRDDLSGTDVARKALILARTLGRRLELSDIGLESLYTHDVDSDDPAKFVDNLKALDPKFAELVAKAKHDGKVLRYVARIGRRTIRVGVEAVAVACRSAACTAPTTPSSSSRSATPRTRWSSPGRVPARA